MTNTKKMVELLVSRMQALEQRIEILEAQVAVRHHRDCRRILLCLRNTSSIAGYLAWETVSFKHALEIDGHDLAEALQLLKRAKLVEKDGPQFWKLTDEGMAVCQDLVATRGTDLSDMA